MTDTAQASETGAETAGAWLSRSLRRRARAAASLSASAVVAIAFFWLAWQVLPARLDRTDVVGHPIHANFNINRYFWVYGLFLAAQAVALASLVALRHALRVSRPNAREHRAIEQSDRQSPARSLFVGALARALFVGCVFGIELVVATGAEHPVSFVSGVAGVYAGVLAIGLLALRRLAPRQNALAFAARANAVAAPVTVLLLYGVSEHTEIKIASTGRTFDHSWLPAWLALSLAIVATGAVALSVRRLSPERRTDALERRMLLLVVAPVVLFLVLAAIPRPLSKIDTFHEGKLIAAEQLAEHGALPWRDLVLEHGPLVDVAFPGIGLRMLENSWWGFRAGTTLLLVPITWLALYLLFVHLFGRDWLFLAITQLALVSGALNGLLPRWQIEPRWLLQPFALLMLAAVLQKGTLVRVSALAVVLGVQALGAAETAVAIPAALAVLVAFEVYNRNSERAFLENYRRTALFIAAGTVLLGVAVAVLAAMSALEGFVVFYRWIAPGVDLLSGVPFSHVELDAGYMRSIAAPLVAATLAFWYVVFQILRRRSLAIDEWVIASAALLVAFYYPKFLTRVDHIDQVLEVATPLLFYVTYRLVVSADAGQARLLSALGVRPRLKRPTALALMALVLFVAPRSLVEVVREIPARLTREVPQASYVDRLGAVVPNTVDASMVRDLRTLTDAYAGTRGPILDMSNNPGLVYYLLGHASPTSYYDFSMAFHQDAQRDLLAQLRRRPPKLVVFTGRLGNSSWDGIPNEVRHYEVSRWVLDHYVPFVQSHGFLLLRHDRASVPDPGALPLVQRPTTNALRFRTFPCDWRYAPNFLSAAPSSRVPATAVPFRKRGRFMSVTGWAADLPARRPAAGIVVTTDDRVVARGTPTLARQDVSGHYGIPRLVKSGFELTFETPPGHGQLHVFGVSNDGRAWELEYNPALRWTARATAAPPGFRLDRIGAPSGAVDASLVTPPVLELSVPAALRARADWLELELAPKATASSFVLSDELVYRPGRWQQTTPLHRPQPPTEPDRGISFKVLPNGNRTIHVLVGSCTQWHSYRGDRLYMATWASSDVRSVRLLP